MVRRSVLGLVFASVAVWSSIAAQSPPPPQQQTPFRTEANYVRVDVFPTKDGQPVANLTADDFEILDEGVPQRIEAFQRVAIRGSVPQNIRREPNTVAESRTMAGGAGARVFVLFLDVNHVDIDSSRRIRQPLVSALDRLIGPDDLIGVMTPEMSARDVALARKTTTIDGILSRYWTWGERDRQRSVDPVDDEYRLCYPGRGRTPACQEDDRGVADQMIERRKEKQTLDALSDLVKYLDGVSDGRKAILAVTEGWRLFQPDQLLARELYCQAPLASDVGVNPRTGKITTKNTDPSMTFAVPASCERDRMMLANIDDQRQFRDITAEANRANVSFYPIDPRGLAVFDTSLAAPVQGVPTRGVGIGLSPGADHARVTARLESLHTLAEDTDGVAVLNTNDLSGGLRRVSDDLSSYYLLGYYSTGTLDGKFHSVSVRVKRPGVDVRARRGYLAARLSDLTGGAGGGGTAATAGAAAEASVGRAVDLALAPLGAYAREAPLRLMTVSAWKPDGTPAIWLVAEAGRKAEWMGGGEVNAMLTDRTGATIASTRGAIEPGSGSVRLSLSGLPGLAPGEYDLQLRVKPAGTAPATIDSTRIVLSGQSRATGAIFLRRGPTTGNRELPTADLRFRRSDRLSVEVPAPAAADEVTAQLLDRTGKPLSAIPVAAGSRVDPDGLKWLVAQVSLVPLGVGDYLVELKRGSSVMLFAFRVVQ